MTDARAAATPSGTGAAVRVLSLIKGLGPGGAERLLVAFAQRRDRAAFDLDVAYLLPWKDALVPELAAQGVDCTCFGVRHEQDLRWAASLRRLLVSGRYDVVHVHSPYVAGIARLVVRSLPRERRPAVVYTTHNNWRSFRPVTRLLNRLTLPLDDADVVVSHEAHASIPPNLRDRVEVLVHGVVLEDIAALRQCRRDVRRELGAGDADVLIGTVANFRANKDWPNLLRALRQVLDERSKARFVGVGQGPLEPEVRAASEELGLGDRVLLLGHRPDAVRVMAGCDLFVLASAVEGLPVAVMEALALGLPVVATAVGGVPEMIVDGENGVLVPPGDSEALAAALLRLVDDAGAREAMAGASLEAARRYDVTPAVRRIEAIYREAIERRAPARRS